MSKCQHEFWERESAVADGFCPICQCAEIGRLKTDLKEQRELYRHDCAKLMDEIERLRAERDFWQRAHVAALAPTDVP
jgi:hypothetical protein